MPKVTIFFFLGYKFSTSAMFAFYCYLSSIMSILPYTHWHKIQKTGRNKIGRIIFIGSSSFLWSPRTLLRLLFAFGFLFFKFRSYFNGARKRHYVSGAIPFSSAIFLFLLFLASDEENFIGEIAFRNRLFIRIRAGESL